MESTSYVERPTEVSCSVVRASSVLLSIGPMHWAHLMEGKAKLKCSCVVVVRRLDAFPSLPGIVPHRKKERSAPARPVGPLT